MSQPWEAVQAITSALAFVDSTIYVVYTIKTFRQIKRQTDLQTQALLSIAARVVPLSTPQTASTASETGSGGIFIRRRRPAERTFEPGIVALHEKWKNILAQQTNPAITRTEKIVILKIRNHGQSDVVSWTLKLTVDVEPGQHLATAFNVNKSTYEWLVKSEGVTQIVEKTQSIEVAIAPTGSFPIAKFCWKLEYKDVRGVIYTEFVGEREVVDNNAFATFAPPPQAPATPEGQPS